jgi:hypothetical protein
MSAVYVQMIGRSSRPRVNAEPFLALDDICLEVGKERGGWDHRRQRRREEHATGR